MLAGNGLRRRWPALAGLALVIALGVGAAMASLAIAWRTDHACPDHLRRAAAVPARLAAVRAAAHTLREE